MRLHILAVFGIITAARADEPRILWAKLETHASRVIVGEVACALDARAVVDGKNRPIDVHVQGTDIDCTAQHADAVRATVRMSGTDPLHVVVEMAVPEGTTKSGSAELEAALAETSRELARRSNARFAPPVVVVDLPKTDAPRSDAEEPPKEQYKGFIPVPYNGGPTPEGTRIERRPNMDMVWIGLAGFGVAYLGSVLYAMGTCGAQNGCRQGSEWLYVPGVGPFVTAGQAFPKKWVVSKSASLEVKSIGVPGGTGVGVTLTTL